MLAVVDGSAVVGEREGVAWVRVKVRVRVRNRVWDRVRVRVRAGSGDASCPTRRP